MSAAACPVSWRAACSHAYVTLLAASVVLMPFSSLPLLPLATSVFGVALTALLSALGWWLGCLVAFQLARRGRHLLERFTSLQAIDRLEARVPADVGFGAIVLLRMVLPVDLVSFALGLLKQLPFSRYAHGARRNTGLHVRQRTDRAV